MNRIMHVGLLATLALASTGLAANDEKAAPGTPRLADVERTRFAADADPDGGSDPLLPFRDSGSSPDPGAPRSEPLDPMFPDPLEPIVRPLRNLADWTRDELGLEWNIHYTLLYQHASRSVDDEPRDAGTGRLDLGFNWVLFDDDTVGRGGVGFLLRSGVELGQPDSYTMGAAVGAAPVNLNALQWTYPTSPDLLYWHQSWCEERVTASVGKIHPNQFIQLSRIANDESRQFLAGPFDGLNTLGSSLGTYTGGAALQVVPTDGIYVNTLWADPNGGPDRGLGTIGDGGWWAAMQVGLVPVLEGLDGTEVDGNWNLVFAGTNQALSTALLGATESGTSNGAGFGNTLLGGLQVAPSSDSSRQWGWGAMIEQGVASDLDVLLQYGSSTNAMSAIDRQFNAALQWSRPFGKRDEAIGIGYSWSRPTDLYAEPRREIQLVEAYYRIQLTDSMQLSPDLQVLLRPATGPDRPVYVFGIRLTTTF
ncbi:MAG: carbohydrate porin [Planctomycetota bacterium]|jgi:porin